MDLAPVVQIVAIIFGGLFVLSVLTLVVWLVAVKFMFKEQRKMFKDWDL